MRKNPDNKPLRIVAPNGAPRKDRSWEYGRVLSQLAIAESNLVLAGKDSAMPHFIAIVKELERIYGFKFEQVEDALKEE